METGENVRLSLVAIVTVMVSEKTPYPPFFVPAPYPTFFLPALLQ
jgi:hypothetical protein